MREVYDFHERLNFSKQYRTSAYLDAVLRTRIPGYTGLTVARTSDDLRGTDYWAHRFPAVQVSVELKVVEKRKFISRIPLDYLPLETWSVLPVGDRVGKVGWTRDATKETDYVVWFWEDGLKFHIVPFVPLCSVFSEHWERWREIPGHHRREQQSRGWKSECIFVPRELIERHIKHWASGTIDTGAVVMI